MKAARIKQTTITTIVDSLSSALVGQVTFFISLTTSSKNPIILSFISFTSDNLARQEGLEPPTCGFGDRCSTNWATDVAKKNLFSFFMNSKFFIPPAVFFIFNSSGVKPFIFSSGVISSFTLSAFQGYYISHSIFYFLFWADDRDWTGDLILTKDVLYQLSYVSNK